MFTGIVEETGYLSDIQFTENKCFITIQSSFAPDLKVDQSVAINGICLTVISCDESKFRVCAVQETLQKTTIPLWKKDMKINLERGLKMNGRLDGHIVQGHVDTTATCLSINMQGENRNYRFTFSQDFAALLIEKGSICINGVSLTCYNVNEQNFEVTIIPYTFENTTFRDLKENEQVNLEFDILGKYILRNLNLNGHHFV